MPIWMVSPSAIRLATFWPIRSDLRRQLAGREAHQRPLGLDHVVEAVVGELVAPRRRGMAALISATTPWPGPAPPARSAPRRRGCSGRDVRRARLDQRQVDLQRAEVLPDAAVVQRQEADPAGAMGAGDVAEHEEGGEPCLGMKGGRVDHVEPRDAAADVVHALARRRRRASAWSRGSARRSPPARTRSCRGAAGRPGGRG